MMRNVMWLLTIMASACAAQQQDHPLAAERAQAEQPDAELHQSHATVPPVSEPLPEPLSAMEEQKFRTWSGFVLIGTDDDGTQAIALPVGDDGVITPATIAEGVRLPRVAIWDGWRFSIPGSTIFQAVMVSGDGHHVVGVMDLGTNDTAYAGTEVLVDVCHLQSDGMRLCAHGMCGELYKLVADKPIGCKGPRCADLFPPPAPQGNSL